MAITSAAAELPDIRTRAVSEGFCFQIEVWNLRESFTYFKIFKPISWGKRPVERRRRFIQRFLKKGTTGVRLILSGLSLTSADTAPITCNKSSEVVIVAADGTENVLTNAANNDESNSGNENAENAVIKCKDGSAVTLCGAETLTLNAYGKNGIKSGATTTEEGEASLTIRELTLNINASVNDTINAEQYLAVESGTLNLATADVALHCNLIMDIGAEGRLPLQRPARASRPRR